jgi:hypothetical protein
MRATIEREGPELTRRHHEAKRLEAKRQRKLERRETIRFWADIAGAVAPWLTVPAAVVAVVATITHAL